MIRGGDERAVTVQIGAVLLLAILFTALALYQVNTVPVENEAVELAHNDEVINGMVDVRNAIRNADSGPRSASITLGTQYDSRTMAINPPHPRGTIETEQPENGISIDDAEFGDEPIETLFEDELETKFLKYEPQYNEYSSAPETRLEHSLLYNQFSDGNVTVEDQRLINGGKITLVLVDGELHRTDVGTVSVDIETLGGPGTTTLESDGGENPTLTFPTQSPKHWNDSVSDEDGVVDVTEGSDEVTIELDGDRTFDFEVARVGVGDANREAAVDRAAYMTVVDDTSPVAEVTVRDRFNKPVPNVGVVNRGDGALRSHTTDSDGRVLIEDVEQGDVVEVEVENRDISTEFVVRASDSVQTEYDVEWDIDRSDQEGGNLECGRDEHEKFCELGHDDDPEELFFNTTPDTVNGFAEFFVDDRNVGTLGNYATEFTGPDDTVVDIDPGDPGRTTVGVLAGGDRDRLTFHVTGDGEFEVEITNTNSPIVEGEDLEVDVTVENVGDEADAKDVTLEDFSGVEVDSTHVSLDSGEETDVTLTWETEVGDAGTDDITVQSEDDVDTTDVTIEEAVEEAAFDVTITDTNEPVTEGEDLEVDVTVENTGDEQDTQTIELEDFDGAVVDDESVTLEGDESTAITLTWETEEGDAGTDDITVRSDDDSDTEQVTIEAHLDGPFFDVTITDTNEPVTEGETLEVQTTIENTGDETDTQTVELEDFGGAVVDDESVTLESEESTAITLTWETEEGDAGTDDVTVQSEDDSDTEEVTIEADLDEAYFDVTITDTNEPVTEGETLEVQTTIENTGDETDTQTVELEDFGGAVVDDESVTLEGDESTAITLTWETEEGDAGTDDVTVRSDDDSDTETVTIDELAEEGPTIVAFDAEGTHNTHARFDVDFEADAGSAGITQAQIELLDPDTEEQIDEWTETYDEETTVDESISRAVEENQGAGDEYVLRLTITDANGNEAVDEITRTG